MLILSQAGPETVPAISQLSNNLENRLLSLPADPYLRRLLHRLRVALRLGDRKVSSLEARLLLSPHQPYNLQRLAQLSGPLANRGKRDAIRLVLRPIPSRTQPQLETAIANHV